MTKIEKTRRCNVRGYYITSAIDYPESGASGEKKYFIFAAYLDRNHTLQYPIYQFSDLSVRFSILQFIKIAYETHLIFQLT